MNVRYYASPEHPSRARAAARVAALPGDIFLVLIALAFATYEALAHFVFSNRGVHTLSWWIWQFEQRVPVVGRIVVGLALAILFTHLELHVP